MVLWTSGFEIAPRSHVREANEERAWEKNFFYDSAIGKRKTRDLVKLF